MPLVHVQDGRVVPQLAQQPHSADAEQDFLADAHLAVARVEPGRQFAVPRLVLGHVGVHQEQRHAANLHPPDAGVHQPALHLDGNAALLAVVAAHELDGHILHVYRLIDRLLPAV